MTRTAILTLLSTVFSLPAAAQQVRPLSETLQDFERRGYVVRSAEDDGRTHEVEAIAPDGRRIEAIVEAATGEVLREQLDD